MALIIHVCEREIMATRMSVKKVQVSESGELRYLHFFMTQQRNVFFTLRRTPASRYLIEAGSEPARRTTVGIRDCRNQNLPPDDCRD